MISEWATFRAVGEDTNASAEGSIYYEGGKHSLLERGRRRMLECTYMTLR